MLIVVSIAQVRTARVLPEFVRMSGRALDAARRSPGNCGAAVRARRPLTWWTLTGWDTESAMLAYVQDVAHADAVRNAERLLSAWRFQHFQADEFSPSLWREAARMEALAQDGPIRQRDPPSLP